MIAPPKVQYPSANAAQGMSPRHSLRSICAAVQSNPRMSLKSIAMPPAGAPSGQAPVLTSQMPMPPTSTNKYATPTQPRVDSLGATARTKQPTGAYGTATQPRHDSSSPCPVQVPRTYISGRGSLGYERKIQPGRNSLKATDRSTSPQSLSQPYSSAMLRANSSMSPRTLSQPYNSVMLKADRSRSPQSLSQPYSSITLKADRSTSPQSLSKPYSSVMLKADRSTSPQSLSQPYSSVTLKADRSTGPHSLSKPYSSVVLKAERSMSPQSARQPYSSVTLKADRSTSPQSLSKSYSSVKLKADRSTSPQSLSKSYSSLKPKTDRSMSPQSASQPYSSAILRPAGDLLPEHDFRALSVGSSQAMKEVDSSGTTHCAEPISPKPISKSTCITPVANFDHSKAEQKDLEDKHEHLIFNWLAWSPDSDSKCYQALHKNFPGALPAEAVNNRIKSLLQTYGFNEGNTLLGYSLCPDEINNEPGCLVDLMKKEWGHMFPLGGISGAPFVGVTGWGAFSHHVPDDGNIIVIFGPHVAVSEEGIIGKTLREGQNNLSTACGAVIGAYNACRSEGYSTTVEEDEYNPVDMQMGWIKSQLEAYVGLIQEQPNPMAALAYQAYEMVKAKLEHIVNLDFGSGKLVLIGGIQMNMPHQYHEHFLPLSFEIRQRGQPSQNLLPQFDCNFSEEIIKFSRQWTPSAQSKTSKAEINTPEIVRRGSMFNEFRDVKAASFDRSQALALDEKQGMQHAVFAWLSWSPQPDTPCFKALHREFPGALPGTAINLRLQAVLEGQFGFRQGKTLFGTSTCPDEINNKPNGLTAMMAKQWGSVFPLGGLAGVPFAGRTGFKAFSHHVPVNGDIIVVYGPHVGISACGEVGKHLRKGQLESSTACGACIGAYNACCAEGGGDIEFDEVDIQMGFIKSQIAPHAKRIQRQECPMAALAYQAYEAVKNKIGKVVNTEFGSGRLVLIGGIQINMPEPCDDHFLPLSCEVLQAGKAVVDIRDVLHMPGQEAFESKYDEALVGA